MSKLKYFLDTEFHEDWNKPFLGKGRHFIDLISIGIQCEDGRSYYAISKDFDIKAAWNSHDLKINKYYPSGPEYNKEYWLRENVLHPIFWDLLNQMYGEASPEVPGMYSERNSRFGFNEFERLIKRFGKPNKQIAEQVKNFCQETTIDGFMCMENRPAPEFYGYYSDYDWVVFCSLFGKMINLPYSFPMYCNDLKQTLDERAARLQFLSFRNSSIEDVLKELKSDERYPKQVNEHNALDDAKWNYELYKFLQTI